MLEQWFLETSYALPRFEFDVKRALRELEEFSELKNKTRERFEQLLQLNGLSGIERDMILMGQRPTIVELVREAQKKNIEERSRIRSLLEGNGSTDEENDDFEAEQEMLDYLEQERRYWARFLTVYSQLSPLEKIAIGRSNELKELSVELLLQIIADHPEARITSSISHQKQCAVVASGSRPSQASATNTSSSNVKGGFPAHLTSLGNLNCKPTAQGERRFANAMVFDSRRSQ